MPPEFLIPEFQALPRPIEFLLTLVNRAWGFGISLLLPALVFWLSGSERGFRAAWIAALSGSVNTLLKWALATSRPLDLDRCVFRHASASSISSCRSDSQYFRRPRDLRGARAI